MAILHVQELDVLCLGDTSNPVRLPADLVEHAERWANMGKIVIVAALDGTFQRKPFNQILQLVPLAEEVGPCYQDLCAMPARPLHWTCGLQTVRSAHRLLWCISARGAFTSWTAFLRNMSMQVLKLRAICSHCRKEAAFTHRIGHEEDIEVKPTQACPGVLPGYL